MVSASIIFLSTVLSFVALFVWLNTEFNWANKIAPYLNRFSFPALIGTVLFWNLLLSNTTSSLPPLAWTMSWVFLVLSVCLLGTILCKPYADALAGRFRSIRRP